MMTNMITGASSDAKTKMWYKKGKCNGKKKEEKKNERRRIDRRSTMGVQEMERCASREGVFGYNFLGMILDSFIDACVFSRFLSSLRSAGLPKVTNFYI